ncbi:DUF1543 domain-containing protein [Pedobacter montanisoli]|uniref:DUF1543 domain-containing protein n=1 Tax=Pedobacter montanisoli TaxID=2923277 RepID=A0ABS9ZSW9_9SPHI|nr:DUF1543 domain-containing protein [Pedobacter montanisoli]MCJ0741686.1 DUF1543 domain-containing protein [Pedobacter montanisoli]
MKDQVKLFMIMLGCKPQGRNTEQHDIFFGIATDLKNLVPKINAFWPEANGKIHIDAYREITRVNDFAIEIIPRNQAVEHAEKLFFLNLGGYKEHIFEEFHYKFLSVATGKAEATKQAKETTFYQHYGFEGAVSHIDDKYGVDVDDIFEIADILCEQDKTTYQIKITPTSGRQEDEPVIGYLPLSRL